MRKILILMSILFVSAGAFAITIETFDPSVVFYGTSQSNVQTMDELLKLNGYTIEDFEDTTLIEGLTIVYDSLSEANSVLAGDLDSRAVWDGSKSLLTTMNSGTDNIFKIAQGASSFGIGVGDIESSSLRLYVNDIDFGKVSDLINYNRTDDNSREIYIRIDAGPGEIIEEIRFSGLSSTDGIFYDHIGVKDAVPEPATSLLCIIGAIIFIAVGIKNR